MKLKYMLLLMMLGITFLVIAAPDPIPVVPELAGTPSTEPTAAPPQAAQTKTSKSYEDELNEKSRALEKLTLEKVRAMYDVVNGTKSPDKRNVRGFVLSTEVRSFKDIPPEVDKQIAIIRENIKGLIRQVATDIEIGGTSGKASIQNGNIEYELPEGARKEYESLMNARQQNSVSVLSVKLAIEVLSKLNTALMEEAVKTKDIQQKRKLYAMQAAYVYEMSDIALEVVDNAGLDGKAEMERIAKESKQAIGERMTEIEKSIAQIQQDKTQGIIQPESAEKQLGTYEALKKANEFSITRWNEVINEVSQHETWLSGIKSKRGTVDSLRKAAKTQLDTLRDIFVVGAIGSMNNDIEKILNTVINDIGLLVLTPEVVKTLLGTNPVDVK
jgi:hypothetical protein